MSRNVCNRIIVWKLDDEGAAKRCVNLFLVYNRKIRSVVKWDMWFQSIIRYLLMFIDFMTLFCYKYVIIFQLWQLLNLRIMCVIIIITKWEIREVSTFLNLFFIYVCRFRETTGWQDIWNVAVDIVDTVEFGCFDGGLYRLPADDVTRSNAWRWEKLYAVHIKCHWSRRMRTLRNGRRHRRFFFICCYFNPFPDWFLLDQKPNSHRQCCFLPENLPKPAYSSNLSSLYRPPVCQTPLRSK